MGPYPAAVEVSGQGARGDEELAGERAHDGGEDGREQDSCDPRGEEGLGCDDEDLLRVLEGDLRMVVDEGDAEVADRYGASEAEDHPGYGNPSGVAHAAHGLGGHEAHQDMGLSHIAKSPAGEGDYRDKADAVHEVGHVGLCLSDVVHRGVEAASVNDHHGRRD